MFCLWLHSYALKLLTQDYSPIKSHYDNHLVYTRKQYRF